MKSIKRGRGPSFMSGVACIFAAIFGVIWMGAALSIGAPPLFACFGLVFIGIALVNAVYEFKNAAGRNRYSEYDIVDHQEEPDPLNERYAEAAQSAQPQTGEAFAFCPYCGTKREKEHIYCSKCGRKIA